MPICIVNSVLEEIPLLLPSNNHATVGQLPQLAPVTARDWPRSAAAAS